MESKQCRNCAYYRQHYVFFAGKLCAVYCGHCTQKNRTRRRIHPDTNACELFEKNNYTLSDIFASKEYLTKALVQKILDIELLPEISEK